MTYSELLAAIDLYAMENQEVASTYKNAAKYSRIIGRTHMTLYVDCPFLSYLPSEAIEAHPEVRPYVRVNWTPDPP